MRPIALATLVCLGCGGPVDPTELGPALQELGTARVELSLGGHDDARFAQADLIVLSPGVPMSIPGIVKARAAGVPVIAEIELAYRHLTRTPIIAITGSSPPLST